MLRLTSLVYKYSNFFLGPVYFRVFSEVFHLKSTLVKSVVIILMVVFALNSPME